MGVVSVFAFLGDLQFSLRSQGDDNAPTEVYCSHKSAT